MLTIADLKPHLGISENDNTLDDLLAEVIEASFAIIESYIDKKIGGEVVEEVRSGTDKAYLVLEKYPIIELISVLEDGKDITSDVSIDDKDIGRIFYAPTFSGGSKYTIRYKAGLESIPRDVDFAQKLVALQLYGHLDKVKQGVKSIVTADGTINYDYNLLPDPAKKILDSYSRKLF